MAHATGSGSSHPTRDLFVRARAWAAGRVVDLHECDSLRRNAIRANHDRYRALIPAYARLTDELGVGDGARDDQIRAEVVVTDDWFKGYDPSWLHEDPQALVGWLAQISAVRPRAPTAGDWDTWRDQLRADRVFVTFSTGTTGQRSLVPRDPETLAALRSGSGARFGWQVAAAEVDLLLLTTTGRRTGLQAGAVGLAAAAARVHHGDQPGTLDFLDAAIAGSRPVLLYGSPAGLQALLDVLGEHPPSRRLPAGSRLVTGGGWKDIEPVGGIADLHARAVAELGLAPEQCCDTYSAAHLNTVFVSCTQGRYHVPPAVEALLVDRLLRPLDDGAVTGRLAVLDPFAASYPGIVATADEATLTEDPCPCGRSGQTLVGPIRRRGGDPTRGCGATPPEVRT